MKVIIVTVFALFSTSVVLSTPIDRSCSSCNVNPVPLPSVEANPGLYGPVCSASMLRTLWPDCSATNIFYQCVSVGKYKTMPCGKDTVFSYEHQVCLHPDDIRAVSEYCNSFGGIAEPPIMNNKDAEATLIDQDEQGENSDQEDVEHIIAVEALPEYNTYPDVEVHEPVYLPEIEALPEYNKVQEPIDEEEQKDAEEKLF